jgi:hypothetical protein
VVTFRGSLRVPATVTPALCADLRYAGGMQRRRRRARVVRRRTAMRRGRWALVRIRVRNGEPYVVRTLSRHDTRDEAEARALPLGGRRPSCTQTLLPRARGSGHETGQLKDHSFAFTPYFERLRLRNISRAASGTRAAVVREAAARVDGFSGWPRSRGPEHGAYRGAGLPDDGHEVDRVQALELLVRPLLDGAEDLARRRE